MRKPEKHLPGISGCMPDDMAVAQWDWRAAWKGVEEATKLYGPRELAVEADRARRRRFDEAKQCRYCASAVGISGNETPPAGAEILPDGDWTFCNDCAYDFFKKQCPSGRLVRGEEWREVDGYWRRVRECAATGLCPECLSVSVTGTVFPDEAIALKLLRGMTPAQRKLVFDEFKEEMK